MLRPLQLVVQFNAIEHDLPHDWAQATLSLAVDDDQRPRAAALLGPLNPGRAGTRIRFATARRGSGASPELIRRLLRRLDDAGIVGTIELGTVHEAPEAELPPSHSLRQAWEHDLTKLPSDWSDLYAEVRFDSTDYVERAALLLSPVNPSRWSPASLRFRCARSFGYGVSPEMVTRCLERCDDDGITGAVEILRVLSDTHPVATQGPVWLVGGKTV
jgi:hypothetical protein